MQATGVAGDIRVSVQNNTATLRGGLIITDDQADVRFQELLGRVTLLEVSTS